MTSQRLVPILACITWPTTLATAKLSGLGWLTSFVLATTSLTCLFFLATIYEYVQLRRLLRR